MAVNRDSGFLTSLTQNWWKFIIEVIIITLLIRWLRRERNLPPGPIGLPILGYLPFLGPEAYRKFDSLTHKYGPIFSLYLGRKLVVVLGNFKVVKEAFTNNSIMDRPQNPPNHLLPNSTSLTMSNGRIWKEQKQFSIQTLRQLGMGKPEMENLIRMELNSLTNEIDSRKGNPMNLSDILMPSVSNVIFSMLAGRVLDYKDSDRLFLNKMLQVTVSFFRSTRIHAFFPSLRKWMAKFKIWGYDEAEFYMSKFETFITAEIEHHKNTFDNYAVRDYIDAYLLASKSRNGVNSSFSERMLKGNFQTLFTAGSTLSRATLEWSILSMILYPEVQKSIHEELDSVLGRNRLPTWANHLNLPYTMAVLYEVMRRSTVLPISAMRCVSRRTQISGYDIPKGTIVMANVWSVHHDPETWEDPFSFRPERFLKDGKLVKSQEFIPFSYGRRNCIGKEVANIQVFLYFATLMQRYSATLPGGIYEFKQVLGVAKLVILDNICLKRRD